MIDLNNIVKGQQADICKKEEKIKELEKMIDSMKITIGKLEQ